MTTWLVTLTLAMCSVSGFALFGVQSVAAQVPEPGTYRVWLCAEACAPTDSARAIAAATIVILDEAAAASEPARASFARLRPIRRAGATVAAADNVCFKVSYAQPRVGAEELFFGIQPSGTTRWHYAITEGFSMRIYQSVDAGYSLRWTAPGILRVGEGWSFGWAVNTPYHRNAYFTAIRIGEPDSVQCM